MTEHSPSSPDSATTERGGSGLIAARVAETVYGARFESISRYVDILASRGIQWGLMGPRETDRLWDRHVLNSAALSSVIGEGARVADIGSGAGLPGIPLAILRPDLEVVLVESLLRRANFLQLAVDELDLGDRVTVVRSRAEEWRSSADVVACRAVASVEKLIMWTKHLFGPHGRMVALKGESVQSELDEAAPLLKKLSMVATLQQVRAHAEAEATTALVIQGQR